MYDIWLEQNEDYDKEHGKSRDQKTPNKSKPNTKASFLKKQAKILR